MPSASVVPGMSSTPSISSMSSASRPGRSGANPTPQLPITIVVTPWNDDGASAESQVAWPSKCVWMSTNPGVTAKPSASIFCRAGPDARPTSTIRPSTTATSAVSAGPPVPSTTVPPVINKSYISRPFDTGPLSAASLAGRYHRSTGREEEWTFYVDGMLGVDLRSPPASSRLLLPCPWVSSPKAGLDAPGASRSRSRSSPVGTSAPSAR